MVFSEKAEENTNHWSPSTRES